MDLKCLLTVFHTKVSLDAIISFHLLPELCTSVVSFALISSHKLFHLASSVSSTHRSSSVLFRLKFWVLCRACAEFSLFRHCLTVVTGVYSGQLQATEASGQAEVIRCSSHFHSVTSPVCETHERPVGLPLHWAGIVSNDQTIASPEQRGWKTEHVAVSSIHYAATSPTTLHGAVATLLFYVLWLSQWRPPAELSGNRSGVVKVGNTFQAVMIPYSYEACCKVCSERGPFVCRNGA